MSKPELYAIVNCAGEAADLDEFKKLCLDPKIIPILVMKTDQHPDKVLIPLFKSAYEALQFCRMNLPKQQFAWITVNQFVFDIIKKNDWAHIVIDPAGRVERIFSFDYEVIEVEEIGLTVRDADWLNSAMYAEPGPIDSLLALREMVDKMEVTVSPFLVRRNAVTEKPKKRPKLPRR
jgi:hypothetical protein